MIETNDDDNDLNQEAENTQPDNPRSAMQSVFQDLAGAREGVQADLAGTPTPGAAMAAGGRMRPSTDSMALSMGLNDAASPRESHMDRARRILSGQPAPTSSGDMNLDNAMGVSSLRSRLTAQRSNRLNIGGMVPDANTPPEIADNNLNYLDMMTLRGAGDPLGAADDAGASGVTMSGAMNPDVLHLNLDGPQGSMVDQRRARVQAMAGQGALQSASPADVNRRALIAAMNPIQSPDPTDPTKTISRTPTPQEAMLGFSKAGGTGLTLDAVMRAIDSQTMAKNGAAKGAKPSALEEFTGTINAYKDALKSKDFLSARFLAQKMGHKFNEKDELGNPVAFSPEQLPGYTADAAAPAATPAAVPGANSAPNTPAASPYKSPDDVKAAFKAGTLDRKSAISILQSQFGHQ